MSSKSPVILRRWNLIAALVLLVAFALAGWKIAHRLTAPDFSALPQLKASAAQVPPDASPPTASSMPQQLSPDGRFRFDSRFVSSSPGQAVHAASLVELQDGRLRAVWFSGSREGAGDVAIKSAVMDTATLNWGAETTLFNRSQLQQGLWRYVKKLGNPVIARMPDGALVVWMVNVSLGGWAGSSITWLRSTDEGASWSMPRRLVTSPFLNISTLVKGAPFFYQDGQVGLPVYHEFVTKFAEVLRISPQGQVVDKVRIPGSQASLQPVVLVSGPQQAQVYMRSGNALAVMASATTDGGKNWSDTHPVGWPNPDSALAGVVTASGQQWLALNSQPKKRESLALLQTPAGGSFDGVPAWLVESSKAPVNQPLAANDYERLLGAELMSHGVTPAQMRLYVESAKRQLCGPQTCLLEFSYPYLLQSRDGYLHLVYTWHRSRIKHVRLNPLQFLAPGAVPPAIPHAISTTH